MELPLYSMLGYDSHIILVVFDFATSSARMISPAWIMQPQLAMVSVMRRVPSATFAVRRHSK
jgi:hypothetical protein